MARLDYKHLLRVQTTALEADRLGYYDFLLPISFRRKRTLDYCPFLDSWPIVYPKLTKQTTACSSPPFIFSAQSDRKKLNTMALKKARTTRLNPMLVAPMREPKCYIHDIKTGRSFVTIAQRDTTEDAPHNKVAPVTLSLANAFETLHNKDWHPQLSTTETWGLVLWKTQTIRPPTHCSTRWCNAWSPRR